MSLILRITLVLFSFLALIFTLRKIRKTQLDIDDSIYWIISSVLLLVLSIFPDIAIWASELLGIESPANFVFLFFIAVILVKLFSLSIQISVLRTRLNRLVQKLAVKEAEQEQNTDKNE